MPVLIDKSADIATRSPKLVSGKSFDYGTLCSSEQTLVAERGIRDQILSALRRQARPSSVTISNASPDQGSACAPEVGR